MFVNGRAAVVWVVVLHGVFVVERLQQKVAVLLQHSLQLLCELLLLLLLLLLFGVRVSFRCGCSCNRRGGIQELAHDLLHARLAERNDILDRRERSSTATVDGSVVVEWVKALRETAAAAAAADIVVIAVFVLESHQSRQSRQQCTTALTTLLRRSRKRALTIPASQQRRECVNTILPLFFDQYQRPEEEGKEQHPHHQHGGRVAYSEEDRRRGAAG